MKQISCVLSCAVAPSMFSLAMPAPGGDLTPPDGPIAPTMKSLERLEPRRCVNDLPASPDAVHVISEPGQYFLAADIRGKFNAHGILVQCPGDVSIDLNGFSMIGVVGSLDAIHANGGGGDGGGSLRAGVSTSRAKVRNISGDLISWGGDGIDADGYNQVECAGLAISGCGGYAVDAAARHGIVHRDIAARNCLLGGLRSRPIGEGSFGQVYRGFEGCSIEDCGGDGLRVETDYNGIEISIAECRVSGSVGHGVHLTTSFGGAGSGGRIAIRSLDSSNNMGDGVHLVIRSNGNVLCGETNHLRCMNNGGNGYHCRLLNPAVPHDGSPFRITDSEFSGNGDCGLRSENPLYVDKSGMNMNVLHGAHVTVQSPTVLACVMEACVSSRNGGGGVRCPRGRYANVDCQFTDEGGTGITVEDGCLVMTRTSVHACAGDGVEVHGTLNAQDCTFRRNTGAGIRGWQGSMVAIKCMSELNGGGGAGGGGAVFTDCTTVTLESCVFNDNTGDGCKNSSGVGPVRWMAPESIAQRNTGNGFDLDHCDGGQMIGCKTSGNGGRGLLCRPGFVGGIIERCVSSGDAAGIHVQGTGNIIRACSASITPVGAFSIAQGNFAGQIIDGALLPTRCNPNDNLAH